MMLLLMVCNVVLASLLYDGGQRYIHESVESPAPGRKVSLKYDVELSGPVMVLEKHAHLLAGRECFDKRQDAFKVYHRSTAERAANTDDLLHQSLVAGHFIVGGPEWACKHHAGQIVRHRITRIVERAENSTTMLIEPVSYTQIYRHATISYSSNHFDSRSVRDAISCSKKRSADPNMVALHKILDANCSERSRPLDRRVHARGFFSFLSDVWNAVVGFAEEVTRIIEVVVVVVKAIFTGDLDCDWPVADSTINMNCETGACTRALSSKPIGKYGTCNNCFAHADLTANIEVVIQDYTLKSFVAVMDGKMLANVSSQFSFASEEFWSAQCILGVFQTGRIPIATVVPLFLQITVPLQIGANASIRTTGTLEGHSWAAGKVQFGFNYSGGVMQQIKSTDFTHGGDTIPTFGVQADVMLWIVPAVVVTIDGMMEVSLSPKVFFEVSLAGEEAQGSCPSGTSYSISSSCGTTGALSVKLDVEILGNTIFDASWGPFSLWNLKHPLPGLTGCLFGGGGSVVAGRTTSTSPPKIDTSYLLPGATWSGFFEATPGSCINGYTPTPGLTHAAVSFQLIQVDDSGASIFVSSVTTTGSYTSNPQQQGPPGTCILQRRLYGQTFGSTNVLNPMDGNDFNQCTGTAFTCTSTFCPPWYYSLSSDNSVLKVWDSTHCNLATMQRPLVLPAASLARSAAVHKISVINDQRMRVSS